MGNQGKMERNSKVCAEVQNYEKYSSYVILGLFIFQNRRYALKYAAIVETISLNIVSPIHFL